MSNWIRLESKQEKYLVFEKESWRLLLIYCCWILFVFSVTKGFAEGRNWFFSWKVWDSFHYINIFENFYAGPNNKMLVFPPGFPLLIGYLSKALRLDFVLTAMAINLASYFFALLLSTTYLANKFAISRKIIFVAALSFPCSYFAFAPYSDAIFYLLFWSAIFLVTTEGQLRYQKSVSFFVFLLAPWIRISGYALAAFACFKRASSIAIFISLVGWLGLNYYYAKDPLRFVSAQQDFGMRKGNFYDGIVYTLEGLGNPPTYQNTEQVDAFLKMHLAPLVYFTLISLALVWLLIKKEFELFLVSGSLFFVSHNQAFWRSVLRYDWPLSVLAFAVYLSVVNSLKKTEVSRTKKIASSAAALLLVTVILIQFYFQADFAIGFRMWKWGF